MSLEIKSHAINDERERARYLRRCFEDVGRRLEDAQEEDYPVIALHSGSTMIAANQAGLDLYGYTEEEFVGLNAWLRFSVESAPILKEKLAEKPEEPYQIVARHKDGHPFKVEIKGKNTDIDGVHARFVLLRPLS